MKKLLLVLPIFATASWAGTTYYGGTQAEPAYNRLLSQLNEGHLFKAESVNYTQGFLNSTATTKITLDHPDVGEDEYLLLRHQINHSTVNVLPEAARFSAAEITTTLDKSNLAEAPKILALFDYFEGGEPFVAKTNVGFTGDSKSTITVNAINVAENGWTFSMQPSVIFFNRYTDGLMETDGEISTMTYSGDSVDVKTAPLTFSSSGVLEHDVLFSGVTNIAMDSVEWSIGGLDNSSISGISLNADQAFNIASPYTNATLEIASVNSQMIPLTSAKYTTAATGFSAEGLQLYSDFINQVMSDPESLEDEFAMNQLYQIVTKTLIPGSNSKDRLTITTKNGNANLAIDGAFKGNGSTSGYDGMNTFGDLAAAFDVTVKAEADKGVVNMIPMAAMLESPQFSPYFTDTGHSIKTIAELTNMQLTVNGEYIPVEMMLAEFLHTPFSDIIPTGY